MDDISTKAGEAAQLFAQIMSLADTVSEQLSGIPGALIAGKTEPTVFYPVIKNAIASVLTAEQNIQDWLAGAEALVAEIQKELPPGCLD